MDRKIILLLFLIILAGCRPKAKSSVLFPFYDKKGFWFWDRYEAGYMDLEGNKVISSKYSDAEPFTEGLGCVAVGRFSDKRYGFIDSTGEFLIAPEYKNARPFHEGLAFVCDDSYKNCGFINKKGQRITKAIYDDETTDYYDGYCYAYIYRETLTERGIFFDSHYRYYDCYKIDKNGKDSLVAEHTELTDHGNSNIAKKQNHRGLYWTTTHIGDDWIQKYGYKKIQDYEIKPPDLLSSESNYEKEGVNFIEPKYNNGKQFQYGYAWVMFEGGEKGYIDTNGTVVLKYRDARNW